MLSGEFMTFFKKILPPAALLAMTVVLVACGGKAGFTINGSVSGLQYPGLVLTTNGMNLSVPANATTFSFPNSISYGEVYNVTASSQPAHQNCVATDQRGLEATDSAGHTTGINIIVSCVTNTYSIGGAVAGLTTGGLVLTNGTAGGTATIAANATTYSFTNLVAYGQSYGVTILTQPANATCTVANPTGVMGDAAVNNINVSCVSTVPAT
jgi:hypothetical protein